MSAAESERLESIKTKSDEGQVADLRVGEDFIVFERDHAPAWLQSDTTWRVER
jgi:hypothetical protein